MTAACVWQAATVVEAGQVSITLAGAVTEKLALQVCVLQVPETDQVTVVDPPQAGGGVGVTGVVVSVPPLLVTVVNHVAKAVFIADCA